MPPPRHIQVHLGHHSGSTPPGSAAPSRSRFPGVEERGPNSLETAWGRTRGTGRDWTLAGREPVFVQRLAFIIVGSGVCCLLPSRFHTLTSFSAHAYWLR